MKKFGAGYVVGSLQGDFRVLSTGGANYSIPIAVPPGTADLAPLLKIVYNSHQGNGSLGMGFSLQGLTSITRCSSNLAQNDSIHGVDFTERDRFCLNGEQLVAVRGNYGDDGTEYRTYLDRGSKIVSYGHQGDGPARFKVWTKNGQSAEYGFTEDAQLFAQGKTTIATWGLNKISDAAGNYLRVSYLKDDANGAFYPAAIYYTGNDAAHVVPYNRLQFLYRGRSDRIESYRAGSAVRIVQLLVAIEVFCNDRLVYEYKLTYEPSSITNRSRLTSVQKCASDGSCLPPTVFTWQTTQNPIWRESSHYALPVPLFIDDRPTGEFVDLTNSGLSDYVMATKVGEYSEDLKEDYLRSTWLNTGQGWREAPHYFLPDVLNFHGHRAGTFADLTGKGLPDYIMSFKEPDFTGYNGYWRITSFNSGSSWIKAPSSYLLPNVLSFFGVDAGEIIDLNGDGLPDYILSLKYGNNLNLKEDFWRDAFLNDGRGWRQASNYILPDVLYFHGHRAGVLIDLNGNGLPDYVMSFKDRVGADLDDFYSRITCLNTGSGWTLANDKYLLPEILAFEGQVAGAFVDLNGDGLPDYVFSIVHDGKLWQGAWINTGISWIAADNYVLPYPLSFDGRVVGTFADITGSGLPAYIVSYEDKDTHEKIRSTWINTGFGWRESTNYKLPDSLEKGRLVDVNGDGMIDYVMSTKDEHRTWLNTQQKPDLLSAVTDGFGVRLDLEYGPLTDKNVYQRDDDAKYPVRDLQVPLYVVTQTRSATLSNDIKTRNDHDGRHHTTYIYRGAKTHQRGFGFLGFRQITAQDMTTGIKITTTYSQDADRHTVGQVLTSETRSASGKLIAAQENIWDLKVFGDDSPNRSHYLPYTKKMISRSYDLDGEFVSAKITDIDIDDFANPVSIKIEAKDVTGSYITMTKNEYQNDVDRWFIGALKRSTVTASSPHQNSITRTSSFEYDANSGMLRKSISEPDDGKYRVITDQKRDIFGNIIQTIVSANDIASRTASSVYDATGRFPIQSRNALGHTVRRIFDARFGKILQVFDANGLKTVYRYDSFGRLYETEFPDGRKTSLSYAWTSAGPPGAIYALTTHTTNSITIVSYYDQLNRVLAKTSQGVDGKTIWQTTVYDNLGRIVRKSTPYFIDETPHYDEIEYDVLGRVSKIVHPAGTVTRVEYNGLTTKAINALNQVAMKIINVRGDLIQSTDNLGYSIFYQYDPFGNLVKTVDCKGNVTSMYYDRLGRRIALRDPDKGNWSYKYNVLGELTSQISPMQQETTFQYDQLGRLIRRTDPAGGSTWEYDTAPHGIGKIAKVNGVTGKEGQAPTAAEIIHAFGDGLVNYKRSYVYDDLSRPKENIFTINDSDYKSVIEYSKDSRPAVETYPSGLQIKNHYNDLGYLVRIDDAKNGALYWQLNAMDSVGHVTSETHANGSITKYKYDPETNFLLGIESVLGQASNLQKQLLQDLRFTYDGFGNIKSRQDFANDVSESFTYDGLNRLTRASVNGGKTTTWQYDAIGNITYKSDIGDYVYGEHGAGPHALTSVIGDVKPAQFNYNKNGDQISASISGALRSMSYTSYSKPFAIHNEKGSSTFYYDADRQRFERIDAFIGGKIITTLYMGDFELVTVKDHGKYFIDQKHYIGNNTLLVRRKSSDGNAKQILTLFRDNLGSVTDILDTDANRIAHFYYTPFGEQKQTKGDLLEYPYTHKGFIGHEEVEMSHLVHMDGRVYDPMFGRFLSADPFVQNPEDMQTLNRYSYCANNPLRYTDPSGYNFFNDVADSIGSLIHDFGVKAGSLLHNPAMNQIILTGVGIFSGGAGLYMMPLCSAALTAASGGNFADMMKSASLAFVSMCTSSLTDAITADLGKAGGWKGFIEKSESVLIHGSVGGSINSMQGGRFQDGFISAAVVEAGSGYIDQMGKNDFSQRAMMERSIAAGLVGGTAASLSGGNFMNGAATATFSKMMGEKEQIFHEAHFHHYQNEAELKDFIPKNSLFVGERPFTFARHALISWFSHALHLDLSHSELFYRNEQGNIRHIGYNGFGSGLHPDEDYNASDLRRWYFSNAVFGIHLSQADLMLPGFSNPANYNLIFNNCHIYVSQVLRHLGISSQLI